MSKGFTLIELLVVTAIIALLTALILPNYRAGDQQLALQRSAYKLAQDLRRAQEMALSSQKFGDEVPAAYGIYFNISDPTHYILFADVDGGDDYDSNEKVEISGLEKNIELSSLLPASPLTIIFTPPDPTVTFNPDSSLASITIKAKNLETLVSQYTYNYRGPPDAVGKEIPRAGCDQDSCAEDCLIDSFPVLLSKFLTVYDQYCPSTTCKICKKDEDYRSKAYDKKEIKIPVWPQKTIQVNKAGLISIE